MPITVIKVDDRTAEVVKDREPVTNQFTRAYIESQKAAIQAQKDRDNAARDAELAEVNAILSEMDRLGIVANGALEENEGLEVEG